MAQIDGECSVLLPDGTPCRRAARFTCGEWHLVCMSHQTEADAMDAAGCPLCGSDLVLFSHIENTVPGGRRLSDGPFGAMGAFFLRAREALLFELHDEPENPEESDLENEM